METLRIVVPGQPVGKQRPRLRTAQPKVWQRGSNAYTPEKTRAWESECSARLRWRWDGRKCHHGFAAVVVDAVAKRPSRISARAGSGRVLRGKRPDGDNVLKAVCDGIEKSGIVANDEQIAIKLVRSWYAALGEEPCVEFVLTLFADDDRAQLDSQPTDGSIMMARLLGLEARDE